MNQRFRKGFRKVLDRMLCRKPVESAGRFKLGEVSQHAMRAKGDHMRARAGLHNGVQQQRDKNGMLCRENPQFSIATPCIARLKVAAAEGEQLSLSETSHFPGHSSPPSDPPSSPSPSSPPVTSAINMSAFLSVVKIVTVDTLQVNFCENGTGGDLDENGTFMEKTANCEESERKDEKEEKEANEEEKLHLKE